MTRNTIKPIRSEVDYDEALATINELWDAEPGTAAADRLEVLVTLVEAYEEKAWPIDPPDPGAAIKFRMEQRGLNRRDLEPHLGSRGRVSEILRRRRSLTLPMIRRLHEGLGIPLESLVVSSRPVSRRRRRAAYESR